MGFRWDPSKQKMCFFNVLIFQSVLLFLLFLFFNFFLYFGGHTVSANRMAPKI